MAGQDEPASSEDVVLSLVLPAYNEGALVSEAVERCAAALRTCGASFEIIVVDDGSSDDTCRRANELTRSEPSLRVLRNDTNRGQVYSILRGFAEARGSLLMHNGIDLPFDPADTPLVLSAFDRGADVVVVERLDRAAYGRVRKIVSWTNVTLVGLLLRSPVRDHNFCQAYRRSVIEAIEPVTDGVSTVTTELIVKAARLGLKVESLKLPYHRRLAGTTTVNLGSTLHTVFQLLRLWRNLRSKRWQRESGVPQGG